jgi:hypothetical protein
VKQILIGRRGLESGSGNYMLPGVNTSWLPKQKRIGKCLVWIAEELQRAIKNSTIIFPVSHILTKPIQPNHFIANLIW